MQKILILDFGSQYTQLIARRVRECGVYCELHPYTISDDAIKEFNPAGIILSGGPESTTEHHTPRAPQIVFELGCPVLGICYGMQTMAVQLNGAVTPSQQCEFGYAQVQLHGHSKLFNNIEDEVDAEGNALLDVWMSHGDQVTKLPNGFQITACTNNTSITAMSDETRNFFGVQFHPEVTHTKQGMRIIERFVKDICACAGDWTAQHILQQSLTDIKNKVKNDQVLLGLSGGVDSAVTAALLHRAIGKQLICVFVDHGLLREGDNEHVMDILAKHMNIPVIRVDAAQRFFSALSGVTNPEQKRKIAGKLFIEVFEEEAAKHANVKLLAQGTIYPDVIESAGAQTGGAHKIKSHHNVGGLPEFMKLSLVEPLRNLFKDEVRKLGLELGLPYELLYQHPFPGPGLAVRVLGEVKPEYVAIARKADAIFMEELRKHDLYYKVNQAFAVFLPVKSVGVTGDARRYAHVIALRAVETTDFMTAHWAHLPYDFLAHVSHRIVNEVPDVSRVVYDISGKPPATIEWE
jgi:GMP synthase (glutamine-hydrolysing)